MSLDIKQEEKNGKSYLTFDGQIDEEATFPTIKNASGEIYIDLEKVKAINSVGIRSWLTWIRDLEAANLRFVKCPKAIVMQMNMVEGFLPDNGYVESFYVPYYCEKCDQEIDHLFHVGKEVQVNGDQFKVNFDASTLCPDGSRAELDANETKYFKFLQKMNMQSAA